VKRSFGYLPIAAIAVVSTFRFDPAIAQSKALPVEPSAKTPDTVGTPARVPQPTPTQAPVQTPAGVAVSEATTNGWHLSLTALDKPVTGRKIRFVANFDSDGTGQAAKVFLEQGWYRFTKVQILKCVAVNATCLAAKRIADGSAAGVNQGVVVQEVAIPGPSAGVRVQVTFTAIAGSDARCSFYAAAYSDAAADPILVSAPAVSNFGCRR
jgi:hypothetical protein